jgi:hypothetical protein
MSIGACIFAAGKPIGTLHLSSCDKKNTTSLPNIPAKSLI